MTNLNSKKQRGTKEPLDEGERGEWESWLKKPKIMASGHISSVQLSHSVVSDSLWPREPQHTRPPCPSPTARVHPNPCPLSRWCHPNISSSVVPFSSCPQSFPALGSSQISHLFASGGQSIAVSTSTSGPITSWQIEGEKAEAVTDFLFPGS